VNQVFDKHAHRYELDLNEGLSATGESKEYFAEKRIKFLASDLGKQRFKTILDFGCGTGTAEPLLDAAFQPNLIIGTDASRASGEIAARNSPADRFQFVLLEEFALSREVDLAYCNGVFHHIHPRDRPTNVRLIYDALKPKGIFSFWENNPWNPGTRYVMSRIPFDRDAIPISVIESRRLLADAGFHILDVSHHFYFPHALSFMRPVEKHLKRIPFGGQYHVLCQKPQSPQEPKRTEAA
jgi:SAM-dependent methyltransferase